MYRQNSRNDNGGSGVDTVDSALDSLQFSYLDGIPFVLDPRLSSTLSSIEDHLAKAKQLLETRQAQPECQVQIPDLSHFGKLEAQVLEQLERMEADRKEREERRDAEIQQYKEERAERLKVEEEAKRRAEAEADEEKERAAKEEAAAENEKEETGVLNSSTEELSSASTQPARTPDPHSEHKMSATLQSMSLAGSRPNGHTSDVVNHINFSEFEGETDPFSRAELDTINDLQELAAVLQTSAAAGSVTSVTAPSNSQGVASTAASMTYTNSANYSSQHHSQVHSGRGAHMQPPYHFQQPNQYATTAAYPCGPVAQAASTAFPEEQPGMKSSKSVGDLMSEINKMEGHTSVATNTNSNFEQTKEVERAQKRLSSFTPPPAPTSGGATAKGPAEWIPWPDLDGPKLQQQKQQPATPSVDFENLSQESIKKCKGLADMGFSLQRVVKVCKGLGDDEQQMINFCLMVDKIGEEVGRSANPNDVEDAVLLHSVVEDRAKKHVIEFVKLQDFGFPKRRVHDALVETNLDGDKTLEKLLGEQ